MLNKKFYKTGFVIGCLVLVGAASGRIAVLKKIDAGSAVSAKEPLHRFDSNGICTCIPFTAKEELDHAPKLQLHKSVEAFVKKYNEKNGLFLTRAKEKTAARFALVDSILREHEVPAELVYLAFIESGMQKNPVSRTGAIGPWALMPAAAKQYGLKVFGKSDERLNYAKSTAAAAKLMKDMYEEYGDWLLVVAAYNCGPGWMEKAIKRSGSKDYWTLQHFLPTETRGHVKRFIAVHYHFEGHGGPLTMTKAEMEEHIAAVAAYAAKMEQQRLTDTVMATTMK